MVRRRIVAAITRVSVLARAAGILSLLFILHSAHAQSTYTDLTSQSLEDLMKIDVISASKKSESLFTAPAAIFVITAEDITRGGFSSVPDALRMVPGLYVAQQSAHVWMVSARGFSESFNDKMLVLIDGRIVYSTTFGGVYWDVQDPPLEDIDRIEVIRGPGGTLWGANAVNGVINIITKESAKTQGPQVTASPGVNEGYVARVRYGGSADENFAYRLYGTSNDWLPTVNVAGAENYDTWNISQGGARFDWTISPKDAITFDAEGYSGHIRDTAEIFSPVSPPAPVDYTTVVKGGHILARWKHTYGERASTDVLGYCDWNDRVAVIDTDYRTTCDVELQHNYAISNRQSLTVGGGIMTTRDTWPPTFTASFLQPSNRYTTYGGLIQYDVMLIPDTLRVIAGSKFEHNSYTGFEYQPQIRSVWTPNHSNTIWAAVSRRATNASQS
jgi:iron complex outermembrane receptor protein